jgi:CRISPR/Cas system CMR subunit Cmr4 (Cas7 group RAMP superfamily)
VAVTSFKAAARWVTFPMVLGWKRELEEAIDIDIITDDALLKQISTRARESRGFAAHKAEF